MIETVTEQPSTAARILIVEDEGIVAQDLRSRLLTWGYPSWASHRPVRRRCATPRNFTPISF
jgi:hypothetical protein